ncbi:YciI family protein [Dactylosporangium salmoneum]|uniref:YciI family protein n=1 Tax=Dactylosporangium salmoneum TaxID=53361 RepID=UPI0031E2FF66
MRVLYFVYTADRPGSSALREELVEAHWAYMDGFEFHARGPTLSDDGETATGSLHIVDLPSDGAARAFVTEEPNWRAGVYAAMQIFRFEDLVGRTMWEFPGPEGERFLVTGAAGEPVGDGVIVHGRLRGLDDGAVHGFAACVQAPDADAAARTVRDGRDLTVRPWCFGGRR